MHLLSEHQTLSLDTVVISLRRSAFGSWIKSFKSCCDSQQTAIAKAVRLGGAGRIHRLHESVQAIAKSLPVGHPHLSLAGNNVEHEGAQAIAEPPPAGLQHLNLKAISTEISTTHALQRSSSSDQSVS